MAQLKTTFAGLTLNNPIIVSSSGLTDSPEKIKKLEEAGAGAVVLKSVFEEQITLQAGAMHGYGTPEADDYLNAYIRSHTLNEHISLIEETKKACAIPVIASINCYSDNEWTDFAKLMEKAGADALEINILSLQTEADAVVLFNRFYQPDIDIDNFTFGSTNRMSTEQELADRLRWTAIASATVPQLDYAISGGIHNGKGLIKAILAGACATEICSAIYQNGSETIKAMLNELTEWMNSKGFHTLTQFKAKMNAKAAGEINPFERTQFMKYYSNYTE